MLGVETAQLSRNLPAALKILICNMSIGFVVYCNGAQEAEFDINGLQNRRDLKCLSQKFCFEPPQKQDWTCWPCLDFLKKFNPEVWKKRCGIEYSYNFERKVKSLRKPACVLMKKNTPIEKDDNTLSDNVENAIVIKLRFGEIKISGSNNKSNPFRINSLGSENGQTSRSSLFRSLNEPYQL